MRVASFRMFGIKERGLIGFRPKEQPSVRDRGGKGNGRVRIGWEQARVVGTED